MADKPVQGTFLNLNTDSSGKLDPEQFGLTNPGPKGTMDTGSITKTVTKAPDGTVLETELCARCSNCGQEGKVVTKGEQSK